MIQCYSILTSHNHSICHFDLTAELSKDSIGKDLLIDMINDSKQNFSVNLLVLNRYLNIFDAYNESQIYRVVIFRVMPDSCLVEIIWRNFKIIHKKNHTNASGYVHRDTY